MRHRVSVFIAVAILAVLEKFLKTRARITSDVYGADAVSDWRGADDRAGVRPIRCMSAI